MKLTPLEEEILQTIQKHYPNSWKEVRDVYEEMKSFDDTIRILEHSKRLGCDVYNIISMAFKTGEKAGITLAAKFQEEYLKLGCTEEEAIKALKITLNL